MICSSLCRVPFARLLLSSSACHLSQSDFRDKSGSGELTFLGSPVFRGWVTPLSDGICGPAAHSHRLVVQINADKGAHHRRVRAASLHP